MTTTGPTVIRWGARHARVVPWRGSADTAHLSIAPSGSDIPHDFIAVCLDRILRQGFSSVLTGALNESEQRPFLAQGFRVHEQLYLLAHDLRALPPARSIPTRPGRRRDHDAVLALDAAAFPPFWQLDEGTLGEAVEATPQSRFRVVDVEDRLVGYAITGRAGRRGYLQRLAVAPAARRKGVGQALVVDGLRWLRRWRVGQVLVNTQVDNEAALSLYRTLGFRLQRNRLSVLAADLA